MRVACYVDGFNLYHAIDDLQKSHLKWLDLRALAQSLCRPGRLFLSLCNLAAWPLQQAPTALQALGIECHMAGFSEQTARCKGCRSNLEAPREEGNRCTPGSH